MPSSNGPWRRITDPPSEPTKAWVTAWRYDRHGDSRRVVFRGEWLKKPNHMVLRVDNNPGRYYWIAWMQTEEPEPMQGEFDE